MSDKLSADNEVRVFIQDLGITFPDHVVDAIVGLSFGQLSFLAHMDPADLVEDIQELSRSQAGALVRMAKAKVDKSTGDKQPEDMTSAVSQGLTQWQYNTQPIATWDLKRILSTPEADPDERIKRLFEIVGKHTRILAVKDDTFHPMREYSFAQIDVGRTLDVWTDFQKTSVLPGNYDREGYKYAMPVQLREARYDVLIDPFGTPITRTSVWASYSNEQILMGHWLVATQAGVSEMQVRQILQTNDPASFYQQEWEYVRQNDPILVDQLQKKMTSALEVVQSPTPKGFAFQFEPDYDLSPENAHTMARIFIQDWLAQHGTDLRVASYVLLESLPFQEAERLKNQISFGGSLLIQSSELLRGLRFSSVYTRDYPQFNGSREFTSSIAVVLARIAEDFPAKRQQLERLIRFYANDSR